MIKLKDLLKEGNLATMKQVTRYFGRETRFLQFIKPLFKDGETTMDDVVEWFKIWEKNHKPKMPTAGFDRNGYWKDRS